MDEQAKPFVQRDHRLNSLDFLKGFGIFTFILWHCYAYFFKYPQGYSPVHRSTIGVTGLFIFLSGFIVGNHYYAKLVNTKDAAAIAKRLFARAFKLILFVVCANLLVAVLVEKKSNYGALVDTFRSLLSLLYKDRWDISFQILVVIALGLICTLPIVLLHARYGNRSSRLFLMLLVGLYVFDAIYPGHLPYLWRYLPMSVAGSLLGLLLTGGYTRSVLFSCGLMSAVIGASLCIASVLSSRCSDYILFETGPYAVYVIATFLAIGSFAYYILDVRKSMPRWLEKTFIMTGRQSLFIYIAQIVIIRLCAMIFGANTIVSDAKVVAASIAVFATCVALSTGTAALRRYKIFDKSYRFLFA
jgi:hypothetical protein